MTNRNEETDTPSGAGENTEAQAAERTEAVPRLSVVGLGASAGGLAPLRTFLSALPPDTGMTFVVVTHLSPQHESILAELLQPHTAMPVQQVTERVEMQRNHVYVIPPGKRLLVLEGHLDLAEFEMPRGQRLQIDTFFRSLAAHHGDGGAVILSGSGSDGAVGIQSIKEGGGLILVQDPAEAEYDGMPKSAIATGLVDIVAPVAALAAQLVAAKQTGSALELPADPGGLSTAAEDTLLHLLTHLRVRTGHDFSGYKRATLLRRIGRRMQVTQLPTLTAYLHRVRQDGEEVDALYRDLLIHVTEFFRDPETWEALAHEIIPQIFTGKGRDDQVRVWTVGCATGEEAYGIAMLLLEHAGTLPQPPQIQVFASDLGELALDYARRGVYPEAIAAHVSAARLGRFFTQENSHYRVRDEVRERVLFTPHNLLQDPPFSKLDLVLCRNLLIYLQRPVQERVFEIFHYALRPAGYLFLGSAESPESITALFEAVNKQHRLYRRSQESQGTWVLPTLPLPPHATPSRPQGEMPAGETRPRVESGPPWLPETLAPPNLLVDANYQVLQLSETAGRYLQPPAGALTPDVLRLVRPELQPALRAALFRAVETGKATLTRPVPVRFNGAPHPVAMLVRPVRNGQALVFLLEDETPVTEGIATAEEAPAASPPQLQAELEQAQRQLQLMRKKHETTVEELRAANEELQSTNEEYRSTLEELETSKEELQSINEELQTVNLELRSKVEETSQTNSDLHNLFAATEIATLFLDRALRIKRYTPRAADLFNLMPPDQGRPIGHLRTNLQYAQLEDDARQVLRTLVPMEREVQDADDVWYQTTVRPYRTPDERIDGVVITFVDVTTNKRHELALQAAKKYAESIVHTIPDALLVLDTKLRVQTANDTFYEMFTVNRAETEGELIYDLGNGQWNIPALRTLLEEILPENNVFTGYEVDHEFEKIGRRVMLLNGRRLNHAQLILLAITDITARKAAEEALAREVEAMRRLQRLSVHLIEPGQPEQLHEHILDTALALTHADLASLQVHTRERGKGGEFRLLGHRGFDEDAVRFWEWVTNDSRSACGKALLDSERFEIEDINTSALMAGSEDLRVSQAIGIRSVQTTPLFSRAGEMLGAFSTHWKQPHRLSEAERRMLDVLARQAADLLERQRVEATLRASEERLQLAMEATELAVFEWDLVSDRVTANERFRAQYGLGPDEPMSGARLLQHGTHPADQERIDEHVGRAMEPDSDGRYAFEYRLTKQDADGERWILTHGQVYFEGTGTDQRPVRVLGTNLDITARKRAEEALREARVYAESIVETLHEPLLVLHPDLRVKSANQAFYDHFAVNQAETEGRLVYELGNGQWDIPELRTLLEDVLPDSNVFNDYEVAHDFEDIGVRVMLVNARRLDHVQLILLGIRDITERKQAEEALRQSEERFRLFGEASSDVLWIRDAERLQWEYLSPAFETVYGYRRSAVMGPDDLRHWAELIMPEDREHALAAIERVRGGERVTFEYRVRRPDGEVHWLRNTDFPIRDERGHIRRIGGIGQDVTEQKRMDAALRQWNETLEAQVQARTAQVRTLASTLTMAEQAERRRISQLLHDDLQQLLYGIQMRTMSLIQDIGQTEPATSARYGQEIYDWLSDAIGITRQITVDLSPPVLTEEGVAEALRWLTRQMAETQGLTVAVRAASALPAVDEDMRVLLFQIVRELLFNVVKHAGVNEATVELREGAAGELLIAVSDQGQGFDVAAAAAAHDGGFGLFSVRERLALFGGQMTIDSAPGAGTTVTLALVTAPPTAASAV